MGKRLILVVLAGVTAFSLSGCTESGNHAATVGDQVITTSDVDFLTRMQCDAIDAAAADPKQQEQAETQTLSAKALRALIVNGLIQSVLNEQLAAKEGATDFDQSTYQLLMEQFEPAVQEVPAKDRARYRKLVGNLYKGQLQVMDIVRKKLVGAGVASPTQDQILEGLPGEQEAFRKTVKIEVNPVYGADDSGTAGKVDSSLSLPVSDYAKQAAAAQQNPDWVAALPANLRCG